MTSPVGKGVPAWIAPIAAIAGPSASSRAASGPPAIVGFGPRTASSQAPRVKVNGLEDAIARGRSLPSTQAQVGRAPLASSSWGSARGYIQSKITATDAGWEIEVETHHAERGDDVSLFVSVRVTDPPVEHWVPLAMPFAGVMDGASGSDKHGLFVTTKKFFVALADVNAFFAKHGADKLVFRPGDPLSIDAYWQGAGHQSGGRRDASQGWLATPPLVAVGSPLDVRSAAVPIAKPAAPVVTGRASDKPVDLAIALPDALVQKYPAVFPKGAKLVSRREAEMKLEPKTFDELKDFTLRLDALSRLPAGEQERALAAIFGEDGWSLARTERYYTGDTYAPGELVWRVMDDAGERDFDFAGLPKVAGMLDHYQDALDLRAARGNGAVRFRDGEIKDGERHRTMGKLNVKPGGGVKDPGSLVATRIEYALDTLPGIASDAAAMAELTAFLRDEAPPFNPLAEYRKKNPAIRPDVVATNVLDNDALRYKFTLRHASGLEAEISNDFIHVTGKHAVIEPPSTRGASVDEKHAHWQQQLEAAGRPVDPTPGVETRASFVEYTNAGTRRLDVDVTISRDAGGAPHVLEVVSVRGKQVEIELEHVQAVAIAPVQEAPAIASRAGITVVDRAQQSTVLAGLSDRATCAGQPKIHNLEDLAEADLYSDGSYLQMSAAANKLRAWGFGSGVKPTRQKAAYALEMMGMIASEPTPRLSAVIEPHSDGVSIAGGQGRITLSGTALKSRTPVSLRLRLDDFPIEVPLLGDETAAQLGRAIAEVIDRSVVFRAEVTVSDVVDRFRRPTGEKRIAIQLADK